MTTVTGKLIGPSAPQRVEVTATLVDVTGKPVIGYVAGLPGEVIQSKKITVGSEGAWSVDLTPNAAITADAGDTLWAIAEGRALDGTPNRTYVVVPASGSHWVGSIRADLSDTQAGQGEVVYLPGPAGPQGATGPAGPTGPAGAAGPAGETGPQGAQGATGPAGPAGADGTDGQPGPAGTQGPTGPKGDTGDTGPAGPKGDQGDTGPQPPLGAAGTGPTTALRSDDPTTTNPRTPTLHADSHASAGSDPLTPASIGAYPATDGNTLNGYVTDLQNRVGGAFGLENRMTAAETSIGGALPAAGGTISGSLAVTGNALGETTPSAHGIAAWCYDPALAVNSTVMSNGVLYLTRVNIAAAVTATELYWWVGNSGSSPVAGQNAVGLYASDGILLASANVDAAISSAGLKTTLITGTPLSAGAFYWVGMLFNASVAPTLTRASGWTGVNTAANLGLPAAAMRFATNGTGRTVLPSPLTPASNAGTDIAGPWAAVGA